MSSMFFRKSRSKRDKSLDASKNGLLTSPIKRYCADAKCPYVVVTDYLQSVLLGITDYGVKYDGEKPKYDENLLAYAYVEKDGIPPQFLIYIAAMRRMQEAGLLTVK